MSDQVKGEQVKGDQVKTEEILKDLQSIFRKVFYDEKIVINSNMTAADVKKWDSLAHIDMIVMVEEHFKIKIPTLKAAQLKNVGELVQLIAQKKTVN